MRNQTCFVLLLLIVLGLSAAQDPARADPALYDVTGVEWGDVLYMRTTAKANGRIVAAIPYNGRAIEIVTGNGQTWVKVRYRSATGYVASKFLKPAADEHAALPVALECHGTEPFWTIKIAPNASTYQFQDEAKEPMTLGALAQAQNRSDGWVATGGTSSAPTAIFLSRAEACSNGMSDDMFPYSITAKVPNGGVVSGCCK